MSSSALPTLSRNLRGLPSTALALLRALPPALSLYSTLRSRANTLAPPSYVDQKEMWLPIYWRRRLGRPNFFIDKTLHSVVSQPQLAQYASLRFDLLKVAHPLWATLCTGGWGVLLWPLWFANDTWMPALGGDGEAGRLRSWRAAQDLYRYRFIPAMLVDYRWNYEKALPVPPHLGKAWETLLEKNDVWRDPVACRGVAEMYESVLSFHRFRRLQGRLIVRAMGLPSYPLFGLLCAQGRIRDYWELVFNEDYMVMQPGALEKMTEEGLFDYAWRRFLAPVDKNLTHEEVLRRVRDYHTFLGGEKFLDSTYHPNMFTTLAYCMGYYNEPAFLEGNVEELEENDFDHLKWWGRDLFLRRLEFENGPLRDQVEAHSQKVLQERKNKLLEGSKSTSG